MIERVLVVDDDALDGELMVEMLSSVDDSLEVVSAGSGTEALELMEKVSFDVVFTDLAMPGMNGIELLEHLKAGWSSVDVVMVTGNSDIPVVVEAVRKGCFDYLVKPVRVEQVEILLHRLEEHRRLVEENAYLRRETAACGDDDGIIGASGTLQAVYAQACLVAPTDATVLIEGESGTGKELFAALIHRRSCRKDGPFIRVNCAALSESLLESELFGHEKGAFTGAHATRRGRFELADGGTIMLDEITETSPKLQAELLRVVETREFERVGGSRTIRVDVRIVATTNRNMEEEVEKGNFRADLFYRLNVVPLKLPPLRERKEDIALLCNHFLERFAGRLGRPVPVISPEALRMLEEYTWPGNVRELENMMQRLVILCGNGRIDVDDLPPYLRREVVRCVERKQPVTLEEIEREAILTALKEEGWNRTRAARRLNISTRTILNKLKKYMEEGYVHEKVS